MIAGERVVALIPARAGSKGLPGKNIRPLAGKPMIAWTIAAALAAPEVDRVVVSTDGEDIAQVARAFGAEVIMRPAALATDGALVIDTIRHVRDTLLAAGETAAVMVLLQPTSPLRAASDISAALTHMEQGGFDSVCAFIEARLNPHRAFRIADGRPEVFIAGADPWLPRQKLPEAYELNGAVYAFRADRLAPGSASLLFGKAGATLMPKERSLDIDDAVDFAVAEAMMRTDVG